MMIRDVDFNLRTLRKMKQARVVWPKGDEFEHFSRMMQSREDLITNRFGVVDGTHFNIAVPWSSDDQSVYYNGWTATHDVTCLFVWTPDGCISYSKVNIPGICHDSHNASELYQMLLDERITPREYGILGDSAFKMSPKLWRPFKRNEWGKISDDQYMTACQLHAQIVSLRQIAEWGNRSLKGSFARLYLPLSWDCEKRAQLLEVCVRLLNLRTRIIGSSQIRTVFANACVSQRYGFDRVCYYYGIL